MSGASGLLLGASRAEVVKYGKKLVETGLTSGTGGNVSVFDREQGLCAISPSGLDYFETSPEDVAVVDLDGKVVDGARKPSSELGFHLAIYKARPDVAAVVHTHSVHATALACLGWELPAVHYLVGYAGDKVPLAPYATFGTMALAEAVVAHMGGYDAVLMQNHGLVAAGRSAAAAFAVAEEIEFVARVYLLTKSVGEPVIVPPDEMRVVLEKFKDYRQK